jgi:RimJ/RimL family protein N-acetyltransferase
MSEPTPDRPPGADRPPVPDRPLVHGERVWLRPLEERDLAAYVAGMNDTEVGGWAGYREPMSVEQAGAWLQHIGEDSRHGRGWFFAVCELGDDRFIGTTWLKDVNLSAGIGELAIFMDRDHIGSGWGSDAQRALLTFAFTNVGLQRVFLTVFAANERAIRSYEKLGFQREGLLRRSWRGIRGLEDSVIMAILKEEWEAQPRA